MFNYLGIEQAIKYINNKVDYDFTLSNLKELQAFGYVSTVFFYEGLAKFSLMSVDAYCSINGYFKLPEIDNLISTEPIYFDTCLLSLAANDYQDSYGDITVSLIPDDDSDEIVVLDRTNKTLKVSPYDYDFRLTEIDEQGELIEINSIAPDAVRISKTEIDNWLNNTTNLDTDHSQKIAELEKQLSKVSAELAASKTNSNEPLDDRSEKSYLNTIGLLLELMTSPRAEGGQAPFPSESDIIARATSSDKSVYGQGKSKLEERFRDAKLILADTRKNLKQR